MGVFGKAEGSDNFLDYDVYNSGANGFCTLYTDYESQVTATYEKANACALWGSTQTILIINLLKAFISGEGVSTQFDDEDTERRAAFNNWRKFFFRMNNEPNGYFTSIIDHAVKCGKVLLQLVPSTKMGKEYPFIRIISYKDYKYKVIPKKGKTFQDLQQNGFVVEFPGAEKKTLDSETDKLFYWVIGSKDDVNKTPYKYHACLTDIENYDRNLKNIRQINYVGSKITPTFKCQNANEVQLTVNQIKKSGWKIGKAFVGTADFEYKAPQNTASIDLLLREIENIGIIVSAVTHIPIHWFGFVQLMSNRSTAESLFDMISVGTKDERNSFADLMYDILISAQEMYAKKGMNNRDYIAVEKNITVKVPIIDYARFESIIKSLSIARADGVLSKKSYQQMIPGVDASIEAENLKNEEENEEVQSVLTNALANNLEEADNGEDE